MALWYTYEDCCLEFSTRLVWSSVGWLLSFDVAINFVIKLVTFNLLAGY
jgi:hypothetical protein